MNTQDLIRRVARGDHASFETLYRTMQRPMLGYAAGILAGDRAAAEDAVDEAFIDIWRSAGSFSGTGSADGWVRRLVRNKAIDLLRRNKAQHLSGWSEAAEQRADPAPSPEDAAVLANDLDWLRTSLNGLNPAHREALILCYFEQRPLSEIAAIMECPENTVKTRLFHARAKLRQQSQPITAQAAE